MLHIMQLAELSLKELYLQGHHSHWSWEALQLELWLQPSSWDSAADRSSLRPIPVLETLSSDILSLEVCLWTGSTAEASLWPVE